MSLNAEVLKFRSWAEARPLESRNGEWECDYHAWEALHSEATKFAASVAPDRWSNSDVDDLLYAIARDNELEHIASTIAESPDALLRLASVSVPTSEHDAKWQLAAQLGHLATHKKQAEAILLDLVDDEEEYVRRRALLALGTLQSSQAEACAERAWKTGLEYQRLAALSVLDEISSPKLDGYIQSAFEDGRDILVHRAVELQRQSNATT